MKKILFILIPVLIVALIIFLIISNKKYDVIFVTGGGTSIPYQRLKKGSLITKPEDPKLTGYTFDGWYYEDNLFDFNTKIENDITLNAKWK